MMLVSQETSLISQELLAQLDGLRLWAKNRASASHLTVGTIEGVDDGFHPGRQYLLQCIGWNRGGEARCLR